MVNLTVKTIYYKELLTKNVNLVAILETWMILETVILSMS